MPPFVEILLSTYNGEKYLSIQLDSIIQQDYTHWKLLIRDDGSTDNTLSILKSYIQKHPGKMELITGMEGNLGFSASFSKLLRLSSADYVMYCDQDDYWHPNKISTMVAAIREQEQLLPGKAHIVFSDLEVADSELNVISSSFLKMMHYSPSKGMQAFFLKNYAPGCNLLFNKTLVHHALKTNNIVNLHDHWLFLVCVCTGKITFMNKPLMKYRMHPDNAIGFVEPNMPFRHKFALFFKDCLKYAASNKKYRELLYDKNIRQVQNICAKLNEMVSKDGLEFSLIDKSNYFSRKLKNITKPYILENSLLKQLTYIICF